MRVALKSLVTVAILAVAFSSGTANAQHYSDYNYPSPGYSGGYYSGPVYHPPSVHYDRVYHADYTHWTPSRGLHTHGHYDAVPHYTPGHYDFQHGNHVHPNAYYHHR